MKKIVYAAVAVVAVAVLILVLAIFKKNSFTPIELSAEKFSKNGIKDEYAILYYGEIDDEKSKFFKNICKNFDIKLYVTEYDEQAFMKFIADNELLYDGTNENNIIVFEKGKPVSVVNYKDNFMLEEQLDKYMFGIIPIGERYYQEPSTAEELVKKINSNEYTVTVFGKESCSYCTLYLPVINKIAEENSLTIYYVDKDNYEQTEYDKLMNFNFEIPAKCTTTGYSTTMKTGFPKPMTIITKKGKFVDCIKGYVKEEEVIKTLSQYGIVKEK